MFSKLLNDAGCENLFPRASRGEGPLNDKTLHIDQIDQSSITIQLIIVVCILVLIVTILTCVLKISITSPSGYQDLSVEMEESRPDEQPAVSRPNSEDTPQQPSPDSPPPEEPQHPNEFMDMAASLLGPFVSMEYLRSVLDRITTWFYDEQRDEESGMKEIRLVNKEYNKKQLPVTTSRPRHRHRHNKKQPEFIVLDNGFNIDSVHEDDNTISFLFKQRIGSGFGGPFWPARFLRNPAAVKMVHDVALMNNGIAIM